MSRKIRAWTDASESGKKGQYIIGYVSEDNVFQYNIIRAENINEAELIALNFAKECLKTEVNDFLIYTDSQYAYEKSPEKAVKIKRSENRANMYLSSVKETLRLR